MAVNEGPAPAALHKIPRGDGNSGAIIGRLPVDTWRRTALVFVPLALLTTFGFAVVYNTPGAVTASQTADLARALVSGASLLLFAAAAFVIAHQETRRRGAEAEIRQLNERLTNDSEALQALHQELESFSYAVSHDLRGPLRAIDGFCKALLDDCGDKIDDGGHDHLARVRKAAQRMGALIDDLLNLSQVSRVELNVIEDVDLTELAAVVTDDLRRMDPDRQVELLMAPDIRARCDRRLIKIALQNLFSNAWKFTAGRKPAVIEFGSISVDGRAAYFVRDNGVGFDMKHAGNLFGAFQRLHANHEFPGTGIGLATVDRIVKKHGGRAWADAEPDKGTTLFFTI